MPVLTNFGVLVSFRSNPQIIYACHVHQLPGVSSTRAKYFYWTWVLVRVIHSLSPLGYTLVSWNICVELSAKKEKKNFNQVKRVRVSSVKIQSCTRVDTKCQILHCCFTRPRKESPSPLTRTFSRSRMPPQGGGGGAFLRWSTSLGCWVKEPIAGSSVLTILKRIIFIF